MNLFNLKEIDLDYLKFISGKAFIVYVNQPGVKELYNSIQKLISAYETYITNSNKMSSVMSFQNNQSGNDDILFAMDFYYHCTLPMILTKENKISIKHIIDRTEIAALVFKFYSNDYNVICPANIFLYEMLCEINRRGQLTHPGDGFDDGIKVVSYYLDVIMEKPSIRVSDRLNDLSRTIKNLKLEMFSDDFNSLIISNLNEISDKCMYYKTEKEGNNNMNNNTNGAKKNLVAPVPATKTNILPEIEKVFYNKTKKTVTVFWSNGAETKAITAEGDKFSLTAGIKECLIKYACGNNFDSVQKKLQDAKKKAVLTVSKEKPKKSNVERLAAEAANLTSDEKDELVKALTETKNTEVKPAKKVPAKRRKADEIGGNN